MLEINRKNKMRNADIRHKTGIKNIIRRITRTKWRQANHSRSDCWIIAGLRRSWNENPGKTNKDRPLMK